MAETQTWKRKDLLVKAIKCMKKAEDISVYEYATYYVKESEGWAHLAELIEDSEIEA